MASGLPDAKRLILDRLAQDTELDSLIGHDGAGNKSLHPSVHVAFNSSMPSPALLLVMQEQSDVDGVSESLAIELWCYDLPGEGHWRITRVMRRCRDLIEGWRMEQVLQGVADSFEFDFLSGDFDDDDLNRLVKFSRYRAWLIA